MCYVNIYAAQHYTYKNLEQSGRSERKKFRIFSKFDSFLSEALQEYFCVYSHLNFASVELTSLVKEDKNSIPQCIGQSHITTALSNMAPFPSRTRVRQTCADVQLKQSNFMTSTENVNKLCLFVQPTGDRTFAGQTYYDGLS